MAADGNGRRQIGRKGIGPNLDTKNPTDKENRGAGDGNRTRMTSLEGWSSTIELHPRDPPTFARMRPADIPSSLPALAWLPHNAAANPQEKCVVVAWGAWH